MATSRKGKATDMNSTAKARGSRMALTGLLLEVARESLAAGWAVIPLAYRDKGHIPAGLTGYHGQDASWRKLRLFIERGFWTGSGTDREHHECGGLAYRMPSGVIGIDIDAYKPEGRRSLRELEQRYGPLPATFISTSRDDGESGIRFFRVPHRRAYKANPCGLNGGIEIIQRHHRFAVVYPSRHEKSGEPYYWRRPDGRIIKAVPDINELTWLPGADNGK